MPALNLSLPHAPNSEVFHSFNTIILRWFEDAGFCRKSLCFIVVNVHHVTFRSQMISYLKMVLIPDLITVFVLLAFIFPGSGRCVPGYRCPNHHRGSHQGACSDSWTSSGWNRKSSRWRWWLVLGFYIWHTDVINTVDQCFSILWTPRAPTIHSNVPRHSLFSFKLSILD